MTHGPFSLMRNSAWTGPGDQTHSCDGSRRAIEQCALIGFRTGATASHKLFLRSMDLRADRVCRKSPVRGNFHRLAGLRWLLPFPGCSSRPECDRDWVRVAPEFPGIPAICGFGGRLRRIRIHYWRGLRLGWRKAREASERTDISREPRRHRIFSAVLKSKKSGTGRFARRRVSRWRSLLRQISMDSGELDDMPRARAA